MGSTAAPCTKIPCDIASSRLPYTDDVALLITVDGTNFGSDLAYYAAAQQWLDKTNVQELEPYDSPTEINSSIIPTINYLDPYEDAAGTNVSASELGTSVVAIIDDFRDSLHNPCFVWDQSPDCGSDGVVSSDSQSITIPLRYHPTTLASDITNEFSTNDSTISTSSECTLSILDILPIHGVLHLLPCLAATHPSADQPVSGIIYNSILPFTTGELTKISIITTDSAGKLYTGPIALTLGGPFTSPQIITNPQQVLTGPMAPVSPNIFALYNLSYTSGGPPGQGPPAISALDSNGYACLLCYIAPGNWSITFNVNFSAAKPAIPTAVTHSAINLAGDGATLNATVTPNGAATTVWFEWGLTNALGNRTPQQLLPSGTTALAMAQSISGLESEKNYFFRVDASNSVGTVQGKTLSFATLATLPSPNLLSPVSGSTNVSTTPTFGWSAVNNATSYRIVVATSAAALPTDPTVGTCGTGCVIDDTPPGTSYTPAAGVLTAGTTYYWKVHARSPLQYGNWPQPSHFTAGAPSVSSLSISPSNSVIGGSSTILTVTLSGPAPAGGAAVSLSSSDTVLYPVPATLTAPEGGITASTTVLTGSTATTATVTVTGTYNGSQATSITVNPGVSKTVTSAPTAVTGSSAVLNGYIDPHNAHGYAQFWVGTSPSLNYYNASCTVGADCPLTAPNATNQPFSYTFTGLSNSTTYYYQMVFYNSDSGSYQFGSVLSFTSVKGPSVTTTTATAIGSSGATLNGTINPLGAHGYYDFEWGTDPTMSSYTSACGFPYYVSGCPSLAPNSTNQSFKVAAASLSSSTAYYFRLVAYDSDTGTFQYGLVQTFATISAAINTSAATAITSYSATLNGTVNTEDASGTALIQFGTDPSLSANNEPVTANVSLTANKSVQAVSGSTAYYENLASGTTYYYHIVFYNSSNGETKYGQIQKFNTMVTPVATGAATGITSYSATLNGTVNTEGASGTALIQFGADPSLSANNEPYTVSVYLSPNETAQAISGSTTYSENLASGTTYYYRTVFSNYGNGETKYGPVQTFTTPVTPVTTGAATGITSYTAMLSGTVNTEGASGTALIQFGIDSSLSANNEPYTASVNLTANKTVQSVSGSTTYSENLASGTTYYYRTVFSNYGNGETKYGPVQTFTTPVTSVTTGAATGITSYSATLNGAVNTEGASGTALIQFGTDSSLSANNEPYTTSVNLTASKTVQAVSGSTTYSENLVSGTTYYYRTVFSNYGNGETKYGGIASFKTK
jgi:hypothetical protein